MSAADRLNEIEARANAATVGPWTPDEYTEVDPDGFYELARVIAPDPDGDDWCAIGVVHTGILRPDAELIAHARTDVPALVAALRAVLEEIAKVQRDADRVAINPRPGGKILAGERWRVAEQFRIRIEEALS